MVTLRKGQLVQLGQPMFSTKAGTIGVCLRIDGEHYGLLFRDGGYDEFTQAQLDEFDVRPLAVLDPDAATFTFKSVVDTMTKMAQHGRFLTMRTTVFPNGVPYADQ